MGIRGASAPTDGAHDDITEAGTGSVMPAAPGAPVFDTAFVVATVKASECTALQQSEVGKAATGDILCHDSEAESVGAGAQPILLAVDTPTGSGVGPVIRWQSPLSPVHLPLDYGGLDVTLSAPVVVQCGGGNVDGIDSTVVLVATGHAVSAFHATNGSFIWIQPLDDWSIGASVGAGGVAYVSTNTSVVALYACSGEQAWKIDQADLAEVVHWMRGEGVPQGVRIHSVPSVGANGTLYMSVHFQEADGTDDDGNS